MHHPHINFGRRKYGQERRHGKMMDFL